MIFAIPTPETATGPQITDIDLPMVKELQDNGDLAAFSRLMSKYKRPVYMFCLRSVGNREDAEELAQDVFVKVHRNIKSFRRESRFSTWLYAIMANTCRNATRWKRTGSIRNRVSSLVYTGEDGEHHCDLEDKSYNPEQTLLDKELRTLLCASVAQLRGNQRTVLIMRDFMGKSYEEIASILHLSLGTVKSTLSRGRLQVARHLQKEYQQ